VSPEVPSILRAGSPYRWVICGLLFSATAVNYIDRQTIGLLKPTLQHDLGWSERGYADIVFWFQAAYALGYLGFGALIDRLGARLGYGLAFMVWSVAQMLHAAVRSVFGFGLVRILLGLGEAGNFPAGLKAVAEWFPAEERAFATGLFNAGANVGAVVTPLVVPALTLAFGWRAAFLATGAASLLWLAPWLLLYRLPHRPDDEASLSAASPAGMGWVALARSRITWVYALAKLLTDPTWWLLLFWLPDFLHRRHGLDLKSFGPPLIVIYLMSDLGSIAGGWLSLRLMRAGLSTMAARKGAMLVCALLVTPIFLVQSIGGLWPAVALLGLAAAAHQGWSANLMTLPSDLVPQRAVASLVGIGGAAGSVGGMLIAQFTGFVLQSTGSYLPIFAVLAGGYLLALLLIQLLAPRTAAKGP
jgi:MFS transporter, ACS family, hexuronate transporter